VTISRETLFSYIIAVMNFILFPSAIAEEDSFNMRYQFKSDKGTGLIDLIYDGCSHIELYIYKESTSAPLIVNDLQVKEHGWIQHVYNGGKSRVVAVDLERYERDNLDIYILNSFCRLYNKIERGSETLDYLVPEVVIEIRDNRLRAKLGVTSNRIREPVFSWSTKNKAQKFIEQGYVYTVSDRILKSIEPATDLTKGRVVEFSSKPSKRFYFSSRITTNALSLSLSPQKLSEISRGASIARASKTLPSLAPLKEWVCRNKLSIESYMLNAGKLYYDENHKFGHLSEIRHQAIQWLHTYASDNNNDKIIDKFYELIAGETVNQKNHPPSKSGTINFSYNSSKESFKKGLISAFLKDLQSENPKPE